MSARVIRHVSLAKASVLVFVVVALLTTLFMIKMSQGGAMPIGPKDETKVPHYFGPFPNWALSPLTTSSATVDIGGDGTGATASAAVDPVTGGISAIDVLTPGRGYTTAPVTINGGNGATATATLSTSGGVTGYTVVAAGSGFSSFAVSFSGGGGTGAAATAYGGVDAVTIVDGGLAYTMPTVQFDLPDAPDGIQATGHAVMDGAGTITSVVVDNPGSGYKTAPGVAILNGTQFDPIAGATKATVKATLKVLSIIPDVVGSGYTSAPTVIVGDPVGVGSGADVTAQVDVGAVTAITLDAAAPMGSGYLSAGIRKFVDTLPGLYNPLDGAPTSSKYIPLGVPVTTKYNGINSDQYDIAVVQYRTTFSSDLTPTLVRGYVQLETPEFNAAHPGVSLGYPLVNELQDGTSVPIMKADGVTQWLGVTPPQWLGPTISATKDKPVRIVFHNLLPTGSDGDLFLPADSTLMGSGMGPMTMPDPVDQGTVMDEVRNPVCSEYPKDPGCFKDSRATLHLHGGTTPWISDGTAHQWITPANETTDWPQGVSVQNVPDMLENPADPAS